MSETLGATTVSQVSDVITAVTKKHALDPVVDTERVKSVDCKLKSGEESLFVTQFCHQLASHLLSKTVAIPFQQFFYCPSRRTEWKLGFDLSIGRVGTSRRIRTMHKMIHGKWCDNRWERTLRKEDSLHIAILLANHYLGEEGLRPYIVLHVCFCVHDYRRMGIDTGKKWSIPASDSLLRTALIDLVQLCEDTSLSDTDWNSFRDDFVQCENKNEALGLLVKYGIGQLKVAKRTEKVDQHGSVAEWLASIGEKALFSLSYPSDAPIANSQKYILTLSEFNEKVMEGWATYWKP